MLQKGMTGTFSIVAYEPVSRSWGVAVQSKFVAVGANVPFAKGGIGAVATQALTNPRYGPLGLAMIEQGLTAEEVIAGLVGGDPGREFRQVGVVDTEGHAAAYTGAECDTWAGHVVGQHSCCQGNIIASEDVITSMAAAFERQAERPFPERLIAALEAGQAAGGDTRGQQSAALVVVRVGSGFGGYSDRAVDLRVDDHATPIVELARLLALHRQIFGD